ncbi:MAG: 7-carboxy-7-deazaguanine synthase QueE [Candidatus Thermoplasmatota archaeon]|nr:7-carboxy-7-deazaguanine synthase QueE [Candidatus Thermoplasmatota archaeon]
MLITEKFHSIQGEGPLTGIPMYFIRTNTCNLRCKWCDTTYSFAGGMEEKTESLVDDCLGAWEEWICLTGGEPLLQRDAKQFVDSLVQRGKKVLIETGGSLNIGSFVGIRNTVIDMDIKTPSSGEEKSLKKDNLALLRKSDYIKFVIQDEKDFSYSLNFLDENKIDSEKIFQPAWGTDPEWLVRKVIEKNLNVRVMLQMHKIIYGEKRGV